MRLTGYRVPGEPTSNTTVTVSAALFADLSDDEREELLEYLAWYRTRRRSGRGANGGS
jgi:alkylhydroperoxidase/carboxymuconolactone decarboxylase family protein YurZ